MSDIIYSEATAPAVGTNYIKMKKEKTKAYPKKLNKSQKAVEQDLEFSGKVGTIGVKASGLGALQVTLTLVGKKGVKRNFTLNTTDSSTLSCMMSLLSAASTTGAKVKASSLPSSTGINSIAELEVHTKKLKLTLWIW